MSLLTTVQHQRIVQERRECVLGGGQYSMYICACVCWGGGGACHLSLDKCWAVGGVGGSGGEGVRGLSARMVLLLK